MSSNQNTERNDNATDRSAETASPFKELLYAVLTYGLFVALTTAIVKIVWTVL